MVVEEVKQFEIKTIDEKERLVYRSVDHEGQVVTRYDLLNKLVGKKIVAAFGATSEEEAEWGYVGKEIILILEDGTELYINSADEYVYCMLEINGVDPLES